MVGDVKGARVASKIAAEVVNFSISKVFVADAVDVVSVRGLRDVDLAVVDKLLYFILIVFAPRLSGGGISHG